MPIIKRKQVGDREIRLHKAKTQKDGEEYEFYVDDDTNSMPLTRPVYSREEGMQQFRQQVTEADQELAESKGQPAFGGGGDGDDRGPSLPGMGGGGGDPSLPGMGGGGDGSPTIPGMGSADEDDEDEDDDDRSGFSFF